MQSKITQRNELFSLMNVGVATHKDLEILGINSIQQLITADPDELYSRLQEITGHSHDPCVLDIFAAIIHEAKTGIKTPWWQWSTLRKDKAE